MLLINSLGIKNYEYFYMLLKQTPFYKAFTCLYSYYTRILTILSSGLLKRKDDPCEKKSTMCRFHPSTTINGIKPLVFELLIVLTDEGDGAL